MGVVRNSPILYADFRGFYFSLECSPPVGTLEFEAFLQGGHPRHDYTARNCVRRIVARGSTGMWNFPENGQLLQTQFVIFRPLRPFWRSWTILCSANTSNHELPFWFNEFKTMCWVVRSIGIAPLSPSVGIGSICPSHKD